MITVEDVRSRLPDGGAYDDDLDGWLGMEGEALVFEPASMDQPIQRFSVSIVDTTFGDSAPKEAPATPDYEEILKRIAVIVKAHYQQKPFNAPGSMQKIWDTLILHQWYSTHEY